ncbi:unnamed protein product [Cuscuta campestris]|uniref:Reverse transcriptase/retrotransposon-derived protein RNase H-like domain-containing protein n=1 Tax=Cuscuta campestris TaxID=132261 RepID=A0A484LT36_9ASTE|nr:unnamed protein product [Cuscuta campestris]
MITPNSGDFGGHQLLQHVLHTLKNTLVLNSLVFGVLASLVCDAIWYCCTVNKITFTIQIFHDSDTHYTSKPPQTRQPDPNSTGGIGSTPDAVQALFGLVVTTEQLQAVVAALSAMGGNVPGAGAGKALPGPHAEHAATSQHKGKKTRRSRRRPCKAPAIEEIKAYNGTTDPQDHLSKFYASMEAAAAPDKVKCRCFLATLEGSACDWFNRLPKGTIDDWDTLAEKFLTHFAANRRQRLPYSHLLNICIRKGEKVREFIVRLEKEAREVHGADDQALVAMFQVALPRGEVRNELRKNPPPTYRDLGARKVLSLGGVRRRPRFRGRAGQASSSRFGRDREEEEEEEGLHCGPEDALGRSIHRGRPRGDGSRACPLPAPPRRGLRGVQRSQRWKHMAFVAKVHQALAPKLGRREQIQFTEKDLPNTPSPHQDALVVQIEINDAIMHRTLVDTGSSVNIMYEKTFQDLSLNRKDLRPVRTPLSGFTGDSIEAEGVIVVPVIVGDVVHKAKLKMEFMVVSINCVHNMILGRPGLEDLECVISPYYLCMKFPTSSGIGVARGDQKLAWSCYVQITKKFPRDETLVVHVQEEMHKRGIEKCQGGAAPDWVALSRFLSKVADRATPFFQAVKKSRGFVWTEDCQQSFESLKSYLLSPPVLAKPEPGETLYLYLGVSPKALSSVVVREEGGAQHPVYYTAKTLRGPELRYSVAEKTVLAVVATVQRLTPYLQAHPVQVLSQRALSHVQVGGVPRSLPDRVQAKASDQRPSAGRLRAGMIATKLRIKCDSKLVVGHVSGEFKAKDERMKKYRDTALELLKSFTAYSVEQIPRAENAEVNILSKLSSDTPEHIRRMANVEKLSEPSIHAFPVAMICARSKDWTDDIIAFLKDGALPDDAMKAMLVRTRAPGYTLEGEKLYKRAYNGTLLRCFRPTEAKQVMEEVHAGICSAHQGAYAVSRKITL